MIQQLVKNYKLLINLNQSKEELISIAKEQDPQLVERFYGYLNYNWRGDLESMPTSEILSYLYGAHNILDIEGQYVVLNTASSLENIEKKVTGLHAKKKLLRAIGIKACLVVFNDPKNEAWTSLSKPQQLKLYNKIYNTFCDQLEQEVWCSDINL